MTKLHSVVMAASAAIAVTACDAQTTNAQNATGHASEVGGAFTSGGRELAEFLDCIDDAGQTLIAAHRGGPAPGYPENAIETFERTLANAPGLIETDVRVTSDGVLVLMHDEDLDRTTTCRGSVADTPFADLRDCRLRDPNGAATSFRIPRLVDALKWTHGRGILELDIKSDVAFEDVLDAIETGQAHNNVILITYSTGAARRLARLDPNVLLAATVEWDEDLEDLERAGVDLDNIIAWTGTDAPNPQLFAELEARNIPVVFGTLGPPSRSIDGEIERSGDDSVYIDIAEEGVDIIATDRPIAAYEALARRDDPSDEIAACRAPG